MGTIPSTLTFVIITFRKKLHDFSTFPVYYLLNSNLKGTDLQLFFFFTAEH